MKPDVAMILNKFLKITTQVGKCSMSATTHLDASWWPHHTSNTCWAPRSMFTERRLHKPITYVTDISL